MKNIFLALSIGVFAVAKTVYADSLIECHGGSTGGALVESIQLYRNETLLADRNKVGKDYTLHLRDFMGVTKSFNVIRVEGGGLSTKYLFTMDSTNKVYFIVNGDLNAKQAVVLYETKTPRKGITTTAIEFLVCK